MSQFFDASRSLTALEQDSTIIASSEMSQSKWLVAAAVAKIDTTAGDEDFESMKLAAVGIVRSTKWGCMRRHV